MKSKAITLGLKVALAIIPVTLLAPGASAATEKVLHSFGANDRDGVEPSSGLVIDLNGNLYGVTETGGSTGILLPSSQVAPSSSYRQKRTVPGRRRSCITSAGFKMRAAGKTGLCLPV